MKNTYFLKGFKGNNHIGLYLLMLVILIIATALGSIPYALIITIKSEILGIAIDPSDMRSISQLGINQNLLLFLMILSFVVGLAAFIFLIKPMHNKKIKDILTGRKNFDLKRLFFGAAVWGGLMIVSFIVSYTLNPSDYTLQFNLNQFIILIFISIVFITIQASFEEIIFRGYLQQGLAVLFKNAWIPLIITSILFGLGHISNPEVKEFGVGIMLPQYITLGLIFGICVIMDEGLEIVIGVHVINNILSALLVTDESSVLQTAAIFKVKNVNPMYSFYELIILSVLFLGIISYKYKWGSFKKIFAKITPEISE